MAWLDDTLNRSTADWVIVNGHHPVYSCGSAGPVVDRFYDDLLPVLEKYSGKLDMYLSGTLQHDPLLQCESINRHLSQPTFCGGAAAESCTHSGIFPSVSGSSAIKRKPRKLPIIS